MSIWDHPDLKAGGEFIKLENIGDYVSGTIQVIRPFKFDNGDVAPQLLLVTDEGEERTLTGAQVKLKAELATQRPEAGDWIRVTLTQIEPRAGGKTLKHFTVEVRRGNGQPPPAPAPQQQAYAPPPQQQYAPPAPAQQQYAQAPQQPAQPVQQPYAPPPQAAPAQPQYTPPPPAQAAPQPPAGMTAEQAAAIAALTPDQRKAMGFQS